MGSRVRKLFLGTAAFGSSLYLTTYFLNGESIFAPLWQVQAAEVNKKERRAKRQLPPRSEQLRSLQSESFDVLIIGGGATGAGCALDAVTRGKSSFSSRRLAEVCQVGWTKIVQSGPRSEIMC